MSDIEDQGIEKPKLKRNYVRTPARDEAIRKMREALAAKKGSCTPLPPTPEPEVKPEIKKVSKVTREKVQEVQEVQEEDSTPIVIKKKPTKKKPTIVYIESDSDEESEPEKIIIKKSKSKSKSKSKKIESSSDEESEEEEEIKQPQIRPLFVPPKLRFL